MSHLNVAEWTAITLEGKRWDWDADIWKTNVVQKNIWDDSIVSGAECCAICRAKYPASRGWQKFRYYTQCECMIYPPTFSPLYSLVRDHGAYDIGTCKEPSSAYNSSVQPNTAQYNPLQPNTAQYSPIQPSTAQYSPLQPTTAQHSQQQHGPISFESRSERQNSEE